MKKMLEQLMGPQDDEDTVRHFTDKDVCWPFLVDICINDLFINTREDIGPCDKIHSETMRNDFEKASLEKDFGIEQEVSALVYRKYMGMLLLPTFFLRFWDSSKIL